MSLHILIISDNGSFAEYLLELLQGAGHRAETVPAPERAFQAIRRKKPDLVIVALDAAQVPALAVEHRVHGPAGPRSVPLIVISETLRLESELLHVFDFIPKPLDKNRLFDDLDAVARRKDVAAEKVQLSDECYREFSRHIHSRTGLHFELRNRASLERGVGKRMAALRMNSCGEYFSYLKRHGEDRHELQKLLQFLTVGETYFFRYPSHFEALAERFSKVPPDRAQPIRIWSAGCSTGEEPYSIAMTLMEALPDWRDRDIRIIATDINNKSLRRARDGVYSPWSMRITRQCRVDRYFDRVGGSFLIKDEVKRLVEFHHLNLAAPESDAVGCALRGLDAVFCRNVLIYFAPEAAEPILRFFASSLKESGQLFLGHAEALLQHDREFEVCRQGHSFYYTKGSAERPGGTPPHHATQARQAPPAPVSPASSDAPPFSEPRHLRVEAAPELPQTSPAPTPPGAAGGVETARQMFDREEFDAALELLDEILARTPECAEALLLRGFILAGRGRMEEALAACDRVLGADDLLPDAYFLKGLVLDASDRLEEAADEYRKALLLDHDFIMPRYHMGRLHQRLGRVREAAREIRNSIRILAKRSDDGTVPYSGGLTRTVCMLQLQNALAQVA